MDKLHVVLDLDATLVNSLGYDQTTINILKKNPEYSYLTNRVKFVDVVDVLDDNEKGKGIVTSFVVVLRPHVREFLNFLLHNVGKISIYSAGHKRYVRAIEAALFDTSSELYKKKVHRVLTRANCAITETSILKDLEREGFDLSRTIIIDDNPTSFVRNRNNAIHISEYKPDLSKNKIEEDDTALVIIMNWLRDNFKTFHDVRNVQKPIFQM